VKWMRVSAKRTRMLVFFDDSVMDAAFAKSGPMILRDRAGPVKERHSPGLAGR
jgi:hypothetical protein